MQSLLLIPLALLSFLAAFTPTTAAAQQLVTCNGPDCTFCSVIMLVNNITDFVVLIAVVIATIMLVIAGFKLVASKGNPGAMTAAKELLINITIGILLVMAAWTLVDTIMKLMVSEDISNRFGPWYQPRGEMCGMINPVGTIVNREITLGRYESALDFYTDEEVSFLIDDGTGRAGSVQVSTPAGAQNVDIRPCDAANIVSVNFLGGSVQIHRQFAPSLQRIDAAWRARGGNSFYRVTSVGGYNCRRIAGSNRYSNHAYGLAVDINPAQNPHCPRQCNGRNVLITNMPPEFVQLFRSEGWGWGGNWNSSKDAMHFSKASNEGGNMRGQ